ncbi:hypothetical protein G6F28_012858 [Rhizopus arrhizus]|nr:hypothetical protein G6F28_012858 [Rhizopus arrhizus]
MISEKSRTYTKQEVFELLRRFKIEEQTATQRIREERELPLEITSSLDEVTKQQHQDNFKRYKREITLESSRRLAIHAWVQGKQHDEDAKDYATRALRLPPSLKHLETKESGSKREAFSEEFIVKYNEANYQQRVLRAAITSSPGGRGRGGHQSTSTWNSNRGGCGFYGRGGTKNYFGGRGREAPTFHNNSYTNNSHSTTSTDHSTQGTSN